MVSVDDQGQLFVTGGFVMVWSVDDQGQLFVTGGSVMVWSVWMTRVNCL